MLPSQKTPPRTQLSDLTILVHGRPKAGKSEWCSKAPDALFLATEAGLNSLEVFQTPVTTWEEFLVACKEVAAGGHQFKTIVVDTVDNAYRMCSEHVCAKNKIEHESDLGYGKGFSLVNNEFYRVLNKLSLLPYGLYLISHSQERELETRGGKRTRIVPTLPEKARRMVLGMVDIILYCDVEVTVGTDGQPRERRILRTKPSELYEAGDRTGRLPDTIDLDYDRFVAAFAGAKPPESSGPDSAEGTRVPPGPTEVIPPASAAAARPLASDQQIVEFARLVGELGIPAETIKRRLAEFGANVVESVARDDMESILTKLRSAAQAKVAAPAQA
jgi:hypothetical protein